MKLIKKIIIADDHEFFRDGVINALEKVPYLKIVGFATNGIELIKMLNKVNADIVLLDINMPKMNGFIAASIIRELHPDIKILVFSIYDDEEYLKKMIQIGVHGYLLKNTNKKGLEKAINTVLEGKMYYAEEFMPYFTQTIIKSNEKKEITDPLSKRELEVLQLIVNGLTNQEIASKLFISERTVINHRTKIMAKTNSKNIATLIAHAIKNNLVEF